MHGVLRFRVKDVDAWHKTKTLGVCDLEFKYLAKEHVEAWIPLHPDNDDDDDEYAHNGDVRTQSLDQAALFVKVRHPPSPKDSVLADHLFDHHRSCLTDLATKGKRR